MTYDSIRKLKIEAAFFQGTIIQANTLLQVPIYGSTLTCTFKLQSCAQGISLDI